MPSASLDPTSPQDAAAMLLDAARHSSRITARGGATKVAAGHGEFTWMSTRALGGALEHDPGDLVATIPAGLTLAEANRHLARAGQWLPLDAPHADRATIGGIVATNDSGPRRHRHGAPRDLILGVQLAMTDGTVVHAGGRVVKNVAGYDLSRLVCGSEGRLGLITAVTFKLAPLTAASRTLIVEGPDLPALCGIAGALATPALTPAAVDIASHPQRLLVRFDSTASAVAHMAAATTALLRRDGVTITEIADDAAERHWRAHEQTVHTGESDDAIAKFVVLPSHAREALAAIQREVAALPLTWSLRGRVALGVFEIRLRGDAAPIRAMLGTLGRVAASGKGHVSIVRGPAELRQIAASGQRSARALALERAVIQQFDPHGVLGGDAAMPQQARA